MESKEGGDKVNKKKAILLVGLLIVLMIVCSKSQGQNEYYDYVDLTITPFLTSQTLNYGDVEGANDLSFDTKGLTFNVCAYPNLGNTNAKPIFGVSVSIGHKEYPKGNKLGLVFPEKDNFITFKLTIGLRFR